MKKNRQLTNGFTLIEVLISLVILSIIAVITSSFLQSSIASKEMVFTKSSQTFQFNLLADALRDDVTNAVNIPLLDSSNGRAEMEHKMDNHDKTGRRQQEQHTTINQDRKRTHHKRTTQ